MPYLRFYSGGFLLIRALKKRERLVDVWRKSLSLSNFIFVSTVQQEFQTLHSGSSQLSHFPLAKTWTCIAQPLRRGGFDGLEKTQKV